MKNSSLLLLTFSLLLSCRGRPTTSETKSLNHVANLDSCGRQQIVTCKDGSQEIQSSTSGEDYCADLATKPNWLHVDESFVARSNYFSEIKLQKQTSVRIVSSKWKGEYNNTEQTLVVRVKLNASSTAPFTYLEIQSKDLNKITVANKEPGIAPFKAYKNLNTQNTKYDCSVLTKYPGIASY